MWLTSSGTDEMVDSSRPKTPVWGAMYDITLTANFYKKQKEKKKSVTTLYIYRDLSQNHELFYHEIFFTFTVFST